MECSADVSKIMTRGTVSKVEPLSTPNASQALMLLDAASAGLMPLTAMLSATTAELISPAPRRLSLELRQIWVAKADLITVLAFATLSADKATTESVLFAGAILHRLG